MKNLEGIGFLEYIHIRETASPFARILTREEAFQGTVTRVGRLRSSKAVINAGHRPEGRRYFSWELYGAYAHSRQQAPR
jgi:hypothetical protein